MLMIVFLLMHVFKWIIIFFSPQKPFLKARKKNCFFKVNWIKHTKITHFHKINLSLPFLSFENLKVMGWMDVIHFISVRVYLDEFL